MTDNHPITPSIELVKQWSDHWHRADDNDFDHALFISIRAARWGADQELEALLDLADHLLPAETLRYLLETRRPKPPSLKEQAIELVDRIEKAESVWAMSELDIIRRALEALPD